MSSDANTRRDRTSETETRPATSSTRSGSLPSPRISALVARVELRRDLRWVRAQDYMVLGAIAVVLLSIPGLWFMYQMTRDAGAALAAGSTTASSAWTIVAAGWLFTALILVADGVGDNGEPSDENAILTMRPPKDVAGALLLTETVKMTPYVVVPGLVAYLGLSVGAGTPLPFVGGLAVMLVGLASAGAVGYPLGVALKGVVRRYRRVNAIKPLVGVVLAVAYFGVIFTGEVSTVVRSIDPLLRTPPLGWLGDLALLTTPGAEASTLDAALVVALTVVLCPLGALGTVLAARYTWYTDEIHDGETEAQDDAESEPSSGTLDAVLGLVCRRPGTRGVAATSLVRAYRAPRQLSFGAVPLLASIPLFEQLFVTGSVPWYAPWFVVGYGGWMAGLAFTANILGNQGQTLPMLLTARTTARQVVRGTVIAAVLVTVPAVTVLALGAGVFADLPTLELVAVGVSAPVVVVASAVLATGIGTAFPRFEAMSVSSSTEALPPSKYSLGLFSTLVSFVVVATALVLDDTARTIGSLLLNDTLPFGLTINAGTLELVAVGTLVLLVAAVPASYAYAVRCIENYDVN